MAMPLLHAASMSALSRRSLQPFLAAALGQACSLVAVYEEALPTVPAASAGDVGGHRHPVAHLCRKAGACDTAALAYACLDVHSMASRRAWLPTGAAHLQVLHLGPNGLHCSQGASKASWVLPAA